MCVNTLDDLPPEAYDGREECLTTGIQSFLAVPFKLNATVIGYLFINTINRECQWDPVVTDRLSLLGMIFGNFLSRKAGNENFQARLKFQEMISQLSFSFVDTPLDKINLSIKKALKVMNQCLEFDISGIVQLDKKKEKLIITHISDVKRLEPSNGLANIKFLWLLDQIQNKEQVKATTIDVLPLEASMEKDQMKALGIKSFLAVPLTAKPHILGALAVGMVTEYKKWSDDDVKNIGVVAGLIGHALTRNFAVTNLLESKTKYKSLTDNLNIGVFRSAAENQGRIIDANPALVKDRKSVV